MKHQSDPSNMIRRAGNIEHFLHAAYEVVDSMLLASLYKLSTTINLSQLEQAAHYIRSKHPMLQVTCHVDTKKKFAYYSQANHLQPFVTQIQNPSHPHRLMHKLIHDGEFAHRRNEQHLPWGLVLSSDNQHIIFVSPHCYVDGMSLQIIGSDILQFINSTDTLSPTTNNFPPPVEKLFPSISPSRRTKLTLDIIHKIFSSTETAGIPLKSLPKDISIRKAVTNYTSLNMSEISFFYDKCKQNGFSLNSGLVSALYEAVSQTKRFSTQEKMIPIMIPMDARRRVDKTSVITSTTVGPMIGSAHIKVTGTTGNWEQRAKSVNKKIHNGNHVQQFVEEGHSLRFLAKNANKTLPYFATGRDMGRYECLCLTNLGKAQEIASANEKGGEEGVKIEEMFFDESSAAVGTIIIMHLVTVADRICWCLGGCEPILSQRDLDELNDNFCKIITNE